MAAAGGCCWQRRPCRWHGAGGARRPPGSRAAVEGAALHAWVRAENPPAAAGRRGCASSRGGGGGPGPEVAAGVSQGRGSAGGRPVPPPHGAAVGPAAPAGGAGSGGGAGGEARGAFPRAVTANGGVRSPRTPRPNLPAGAARPGSVACSEPKPAGARPAAGLGAAARGGHRQPWRWKASRGGDEGLPLIPTAAKLL